MPEGLFPCDECGEFRIIKPFTQGDVLNDYMLTDEAWARLHPEGYEGFLCWKCLWSRAGEHGGLRLQDFLTCGVPVCQYALRHGWVPGSRGQLKPGTSLEDHAGFL